MRCPECGTEIDDLRAVFCPRCAAPLGLDEAEATTPIEVDEKSSDTATIETESVPPPASQSPLAEGDAVREPLERVAEVRDRLERGGWLDVAAAAALAFLVVLVVGAVLVLAAKLNFPGLGERADLLGTFNAIVIAGLGALGVAMVIDGLSVSVLPLGALLAIGTGTVWAIRTALRDRPPSDLRDAARWGIRLSVPFGLLCFFFALVFRFRGSHPVSADAGMALVTGAFWGALFGIVGAVKLVEPLRAAAGRVLAGLRARDPSYYEGAAAGSLMIAAVVVLGAIAMLLWAIISLAKGEPGGRFEAGDAIAYVVYLAAFLPNLVVAIAALSVGAPVDVGAKVDLGGRLVGPMREYSLASWGRGDPAPYLLLLLLIPIVACVAAGFYARRRTADPSAMLVILLTGSAVFSVALTLVAAIGELRFAGVVRGAGYGAIAPDLVLLFLFTFLASGILAFAGWYFAGATNVLNDRFPQAS